MTRLTGKAIRAAELALAETLRKVRVEIAKHVDVGEGVRVPSIVRFAVEDMLDMIDGTVEQLTSDRDADIDDAIEDIDR